MKEYKAIKVKWDIHLEKVNETINDMAKEGWELVCMSPEPQNTMNFVAIFSKEKIFNTTFE